MPTYRMNAVLPYKTGIPRDVSIATFHFDTSTTITGPQVEAIGDAVISFFNDAHGGAAHSIASMLSAKMDTSADQAELQLYEVGVEGPPLAFTTWTLAGPADVSSLPLEVALCLSYGSTQGGLPPARRRGRLFIGPFNLDQITFADDESRPAPDTIEGLAAAGAFMSGVDGPGSTDDIPWVVYSRASDQASVIDYGWVDNAWDTQRRRGTEADARELWSPEV